ncbi:hypothetical protein Q8A64_10270 [Oxalobacteraceae bacterium R-40]|uniref:CPBP family intramembrane metalloprotease n=1 Tax=Keguizhuia sedimenti TaxID=3064264 RepID=A0ABU1BP52_9BURK|nr:hypothetical protein [Oxalobacteraceae bacterium R-40]
MIFPRFQVSDIRVAWALIAMILLLAVLPLILPEASFRYAFSEQGPFERISIVAWLIAAFTIVARIRPLGMRAWGFVVLFAGFAAREADWHKAFTADSILKTNYYKHAAAPLGEKIIGFIVALAFLALIAYVGIVVLRFLFLQGGWKSRSGFWLMLGTALVVIGKVVDRAPAVLAEEYGVVLLPIVGHYVAAFEEGLEMLHPLIMAWSIWISQEERRYLS